MNNFDLRKYLAEGRLLKEGIPQESEIADYVTSMYDDSVVEKEGFQSDIWTKEEYTSPTRSGGSTFIALIKHLNSVGGKDVLEGNPDIHLELLSNGDIKWSADNSVSELQEKKEFNNDDLEKAATDLYDATNAFRAKWNAAFGEKASDGEEFAAFDTAVSDLYAHGLSLQIK